MIIDPQWNICIIILYVCFSTNSGLFRHDHNLSGWALIMVWMMGAVSMVLKRDLVKILCVRACMQNEQSDGQVEVGRRSFPTAHFARTHTHTLTHTHKHMHFTHFYAFYAFIHFTLWSILGSYHMLMHWFSWQVL